jgi:hypothetical protein
VSVLSISINSVRKSISLYYDGSIAEDLVIEIRDRVEKYQDNLIKECIKDFTKYNNIRRFHHLPTLKRLSQPKIYKEADDRKVGEIGETTIVIQSSQSRRGNLYE